MQVFVLPLYKSTLSHYFQFRFCFIDDRVEIMLYLIMFINNMKLNKYETISCYKMQRIFLNNKILVFKT